MTGVSIRWDRFAVGSVAIVLAVATPSLSRADSHTAAGRHTWGTGIAFVRFTPQNGHPQIYTFQPHGQATPKPLPLPAPAVAAPAWSPDGSRLAYIGGRNSPDSGDVTLDDALYVSMADGSHTHRLRGGAGHINGLAWLPDSKRIIVVRSLTGRTESSLWIQDLDGRRARRLTSGYIDLEPSASSDGRTVAFLRINPKTYDSSILLMRPNGSGLHPIFAKLGHVTEPVWSPSGSALLIEDGKTLYKVRPDGSSRRILARLSTDAKGAREDPQPTWSPDGKSVVFCQLRPGSFDKSDLWIVGADGKGLHRLTRSPGLDTAPTWGP